MKQLLKVLTLVLVLVLAIGVLVACGEETPSTGDGNGDTNNDGTNDDPGKDKPNTDGEFTVTFVYIDKQGNPLADVGGYTQKLHPRIEYGKNARNTNTDSVTAFEEVVIIGWNADKEAAKAGTVDEGCIKNITEDKTVYSVVRAKEEKTVTFQNSKGETFKTVKVLEGAKIDNSFARPSEMGRYFKEWQFAANNEEGKRDSNVNCIYGSCTFKAVMGATDGTIGKVASNAIKLDAKKDAAYATSGAYLAHNTAKMANDAKTVADGGTYMVPTVKADTWMVWDGDYIYLLIEVFDKSLTCRSDAYVKSGADAWCNDTVELWYNFEQDATLTKNSTRVGLGAMGDIETKGDAKYALPRSVYNGAETGIGGGRSTHYDDIEYAVRNYVILAGTGDDMSDLSTDGQAKPSYIIEFKIPAWTEGEADLNYAYKDWDGAKKEKLTGTDLESFKKTGRLYGVDASVDNINSYRFTPGTQLQSGDFVYFCLQINDLKISIDDLNFQAKKYLDTPTLAEAKEFVEALGYVWDETTTLDSKIMLYEFDKTTGKLKGASTTDRFSATGSTQYNLTMYLMFSLSGDENADTKVYGFRADLTDTKKQVMLDKDGKVYTRPSFAN